MQAPQEAEPVITPLLLALPWHDLSSSVRASFVTKATSDFLQSQGAGSFPKVQGETPARGHT